MFDVPIRNRHSAILPQRSLRDFDANRRLPTLVFAVIHHGHHSSNGLGFHAKLHNLLQRTILFHISL
jgi:hypothetical protein